MFPPTPPHQNKILDPTLYGRIELFREGSSWESPIETLTLKMFSYHSNLV